MSRYDDLTPVAIVQSDSTFIDPPLLAITISAPGNLVVENEMGDEVTLVVPDTVDGTDAGGRFPFYWKCGKVRRVKAATTIADADLVGHRAAGRTRNTAHP